MSEQKLSTPRIYIEVVRDSESGPGGVVSRKQIDLHLWMQALYPEHLARAAIDDALAEVTTNSKYRGKGDE